jgi:protein-tyrosine-phosphatase
MVNVLFLCTGNSARSILAEAILNAEGKGKFKAFSAGSQPVGKVNPFALELLASKNFSVADLRSKSWDEFAALGAPKMDFIFTVCGNAADEVCPIWPGHPISAHWGVDDPAAVVGSDQEKRNAFQNAFSVLQKRIKSFVNLPLEKFDQVSLQTELRTIGQQ